MLDDRTCLHFPTSGIVEVPFLFEPQLLRCIAAGPSGKPLTVLLDTGTDPSAVDLGLARRLGLRLGDFALGQDATGDDVPFTETILPWLRLGDVQLRNLFALALDLSTAPFQVDVVLGYNVLRRLVLQVDYMRRVVRLGHPDLGTAMLSASEVCLPLTFFEHFPSLKNITIGDEVHVPLVTIDTGSNGGLTLGPDLALRLGLRHDAETITLAQGAGFFSGDSAVVCGTAPLMRFGPFALHNVELDTAGSGAGDLRRAGRANMGNRLLARFASFTLDYERALCAFNQ